MIQSQRPQFRCIGSNFVGSLRVQPFQSVPFILWWGEWILHLQANRALPPPSLPVYRRCTTLKLYVVRAIVFSATSLDLSKFFFWHWFKKWKAHLCSSTLHAVFHKVIPSRLRVAQIQLDTFCFLRSPPSMNMQISPSFYFHPPACSSNIPAHLRLLLR